MHRCANLISCCLIVGLFCGTVDSQESNGKGERIRFHQAAGEAPKPGTVYLFPERIVHNDELIDVERGVVFVPNMPSDPNSPVIGIEVYRFKAENGPSELLPVFRLEGGPGFPGLGDSLRSRAFFTEKVWPITRTVGADLIVVGQRGIGSSKPDTVMEGVAVFPPHQEVTNEQYARAVRTACEKGKQYWEAKGLDLRGFTVIEAAADIKAVRDAFGYDKIIISGTSFVSHWGMAVMRNHPEIIERALFSSLEGPDHTWDMPSHVLHSLERIAAAAENDPALRSQIPEGGLIKALQDVIERVEAEPVLVEVPHPQTRRLQSVRLDARVIRSVAMGYASNLRSRQGMPSWPIDILDLYRGNYHRAAQSILRRGPNYPTASFFLLDCASGISRSRRMQLDADPATAVLGELTRLYRFSSPIWGVDLGDDFRQNFNPS
jgi:pimeloyl-ACP methyl ester carboxylesterase